MDFQITPLPATVGADLFTLTEAELAAQNAHRQTVTEWPGAPCRISLEDVPLGETVVLFNYTHQPADSPYRASHAIYVRENAQPCVLAKNAVPDVITRRLISVRFFDSADMIIDAEVVPGTEVADRLAQGFDNPDATYAHLHFAQRGCFAASAQRAA